MNIIEVPLSRLAIAEVNQRKTGTGNVDDLVASMKKQDVSTRQSGCAMKWNRGRLRDD